MTFGIRLVALMIGVFFTLQGIEWLIAPGWAAAGLGMPVLDGVARSTQFGDFAAFFLVLGVSILIGTIPEKRHVLYFPAALLGTAAVCRIWAWLVHGAAFATLFITVEIVASLLLLITAQKSEVVG